MSDQPIADLDGDQRQVEKRRYRKGGAESRRRMVVAVAVMMAMTVLAVMRVRMVMMMCVAVIVLMRHAAIRSKFCATVKHIFARGEMPTGVRLNVCAIM
jgi:hypothetical protein